MPDLLAEKTFYRFVGGSAALLIVLTASLAISGEPFPPLPEYAPPPRDLSFNASGCYSYDRKGVFVRDECIFRVAVTASAYEGIDIRRLEQHLWTTTAALLQPLGFDTLQVVPWNREQLVEKFNALDLHFASAPSASISDAAKFFESIIDWDYEPVALYGRYSSVILTQTDSDIRFLSDLHNDTLAAVDPSSSSGYRIPVGFLRVNGIYPRVVFLRGRHSDVVDAVLRGDVAAGATHENWRTYLSVEKQKLLRELPIPFSIPGQAWVLRRDILARPEVANRLVEAVTTWSAEVNDSEKYWAHLEPVTPGDLDAYDTFRGIEQALRDSTVRSDSSLSISRTRFQ